MGVDLAAVAHHLCPALALPGLIELLLGLLLPLEYLPQPVQHQVHRVGNGFQLCQLGAADMVRGGIVQGVHVPGDLRDALVDGVNQQGEEHGHQKDANAHHNNALVHRADDPPGQLPLGDKVDALPVPLRHGDAGGHISFPLKVDPALLLGDGGDQGPLMVREGPGGGHRGPVVQQGGRVRAVRARGGHPLQQLVHVKEDGGNHAVLGVKVLHAENGHTVEHQRAVLVPGDAGEKGTADGHVLVEFPGGQQLPEGLQTAGVGIEVPAVVGIEEHIPAAVRQAHGSLKIVGGR